MEAELRSRIDDFDVFDTHELDKDETDEFFNTLVLKIFTHNKGKFKNNTKNKKQDGAGQYIYSRYHRILPEDLREPLMARRVRTFKSGYDFDLCINKSYEDHISAAAMVYRSSQRHFLMEVDYLRPIRDPMRYFYEFIPHERLLCIAQMKVETDQLFAEPIQNTERDTDVIGFGRFLKEIRTATNKNNQYKEGMRKGPKLPEGMKFAWPIFHNSAVVEPRYKHQGDLPF